MADALSIVNNGKCNGVTETSSAVNCNEDPDCSLGNDSEISLPYQRKMKGCSVDACKRCAADIDQFSRLPDEIIVYHILPRLNIVELCGMKLVCGRLLSLVRQFLKQAKMLDMSKWDFMITEGGLSHILIYTSNLQELRLDRCWRAVTEANLITIAKCCNNLRILTVSRCQHVSDFSVTILAQRCSHLQELDLSSCYKLTDEGVCNIARFCQHLRELHLSSDYGVTDISIQMLAEQCHSIQELDVSYCYKVTNKSIREFVRSQHTNLKLLRIKNCDGVTQDVVEALVKKNVIVNNMF